ncbi:hypothetical protein L202_03477 [Cryptococcus amylolentus CBS 6039]|uniref:RRM domain-containing protein n=1 Tax=Cryptococcus amylolentus CBS 6039 TaxID=1295533 RepID=A0A1E3HVD8_9TREE|nr:hypothetical protein L202_03477 [Cryptococcus amylolentus CBS 6039]ODN79511.1 hypothetical protein L202_03477 [Cryptococcus amylolentus CBS 6039]
MYQASGLGSGPYPSGREPPQTAGRFEQSAYGGKDRQYDRGGYDYERDRDLRSSPGFYPRQRSPEIRRRHQDRDPRSIEERINQERPCRTLFVRSIHFDSDPEDLREQFEAYGPIQNFFEMVKKRGMIFVTFFDSRAAERARDGMHGMKVNRRPIDVHYSLPRPEEIATACSADKNQGSILIVAHPPRPLNLSDVRRMAERYGDIKDVERGHRPSEVVVEYFDSRGAILLQQQMNRQVFMGIELELRHIWDKVGNNVPPPPVSERVPRTSHAHDHQAREPLRRDSYPSARSREYSRERSPGIRDSDRRASFPSGYHTFSGPGGRSLPAPVAEDALEKARKMQALIQNLSNVPSVASTAVNSTSRYQPAMAAPTHPPYRAMGAAAGYSTSPSSYTAAATQSFPPYPSPSSASTTTNLSYQNQMFKAPPAASPYGQSPSTYPSPPTSFAPPSSNAPPPSSYVPSSNSHVAPPVLNNTSPDGPTGVQDVSSLLAMLQNQG